MSADLATAYDVHLGAWTDWSRGPVYGARLTLTRNEGNLMMAFLAFFIAIVGARFWRLVCLVLHHIYIYSRKDGRDGLHHQRQALPWNVPNPEDAVWVLGDMAFSWKYMAKTVWARLVPIMGLAIACTVSFTLAGGFSSRVAIFVSDEVLLSGANCGFIGLDGGINSFADTSGQMFIGGLVAAEGYARQCYTTSPPGIVSCGTYVKKQLPPASVDTNASCPFDVKICKRASGNLLIDTGVLDSHYDFGRNAPPDQRVQYRRTLHCAPLATEGYRFQTFDDTQNQSYTAYYYGPSHNIDDSTNNYTTRFSNDRYAYPDVEEVTRWGGETMNDLSLRVHFASWWNGSVDFDSSSFSAIPEFKPQDADLSIYFLTSGRILFAFPSYDDWYTAAGNATEIHKTTVSDLGDATMFRQSEPGSPLACREQAQFCFTVQGQRKCTPFQSASDAAHSLSSLFREGGDYNSTHWFYLTSFVKSQTTDTPVHLLGVRILMAKDRLNGPLMGSLPDNQWQLEVQHWHATAMAYLQGAFLEPVVGTNDPKAAHLVRRPNSTAEREQCANQKIRSEGFVSVRVFGIACIFGGGGFIVLLSFTLEPILSWCVRRSGRHQYAKLEWSNETLQLQRLAQEESRMGTWSRGTKSVPVANLGNILAALDIFQPYTSCIARIWG